jgi:hypothetical protein
MLRALLARKKAEQFAKSTVGIDKSDIFLVEKHQEKKKILEQLQEKEMLKNKSDYLLE